jgi:alpha-beta hydrolase superfamily lysophospholipase
VPPDLDPHLDPARYTVHRSTARGFGQAYVREGLGGTPLLCVHGWPETKRIFWRVIEPLVAAGFEVIVPDLRGFGDMLGISARWCTTCSVTSRWWCSAEISVGP